MKWSTCAWFTVFKKVSANELWQDLVGSIAQNACVCGCCMSECIFNILLPIFFLRLWYINCHFWLSFGYKYLQHLNFKYVKEIKTEVCLTIDILLLLSSLFLLRCGVLINPWNWSKGNLLNVIWIKKQKMLHQTCLLSLHVIQNTRVFTRVLTCGIVQFLERSRNPCVTRLIFV